MFLLSKYYFRSRKAFSTSNEKGKPRAYLRGIFFLIFTIINFCFNTNYVYYRYSIICDLSIIL
uniref:Uncharacterized protein n=1 Tax=Papilio polytes TaxID=76194 RepID=I4DSB9_PAPPL|nr:unknown unsecreted protein [Papilio polytes]